MIHQISPITSLLPQKPVSLNTLSKDLVLKIDSYLGWDDRLDLLQVNHHFYENFAEEWLIPTHYRNRELWSDYYTDLLSFRKLFELWKLGDSSQKEGIEGIFMSHQFWPGIRIFLLSGGLNTVVFGQFIEQYVYMTSDEIIEVLFENPGSDVNLLDMFELAVKHVTSPRTLFNLMNIIGRGPLSIINVERIFDMGCSYKDKFHLIGCLLKFGIVRPDVLDSLLACYETFKPAYLPRILAEAPVSTDIKLGQFTRNFLNTSKLINFDLLKLFFQKFPDYRLFVREKTRTTRWSRRRRKEVLAKNITGWCRSKEAFEFALSFFKDLDERFIILDQLGRIETFAPSKKAVETYLKDFNQTGLLKLICTFPKICFTSQHVQAIVGTPGITTDTMLRVFQHAPGVYPVVDLDPLENEANPATIIEFSFLFPDRLDSLVYLMRHRIDESYLTDFLQFCTFKTNSLDRVRSAAVEFDYSDQLIDAFKARLM